MHPNTELFFDWSAPLAADLAAANFSILLTALSMHPPRDRAASPLSALWDALTAANAAGVAVDVCLAMPHRAHPATAWNARAGEALTGIGARVHYAAPARLLHAKTAVIDSRIIWVGSGNYTAAAAAHNHEAYIRAESVALAHRLRAEWIDRGILAG